MFGGIGGALKSLSGKAEEMIEKTKTSVGEMAAEKKAAAAAMLEAQAKKTSDALWQSKSNVEAGLAEGAAEAKAAAIDGFDAELSNAEKLVDEGVTENKTPKPATTDSGFDPAKLLASTALAGGVQGMEKEVEKVVDEKLKEVGQTVDTKLKEADQYIDQKRDEVVKVVQEETQKTANSAGEGLGSVLGKAKGLLPF
ncbi:uncharacterized protein LOC106663697 isoform X2 [Cimex lectularius]|uniref:Uncharacterized protein n=1 Tax=Cimex lectularius TaxID=79782 RepID=A0A8I6RG13_CIMLE|nr:uncharacterized protein LOC106663697 isoform X2 [Cimex lectularius]